MSSREETQHRIWKETVQLMSLSSAIDRLPESQVRRDLVERHSKLLKELDTLEQAIDNTSLEICYYGFSTTCPKCGCMYCEIFLQKRDAGVKEED